MKYLLWGLFLPFSSFAQQITFNEIDRFTKQRVVQTSILQVKSTSTEELALQLRSEGDKIYLLLTGYGWGSGAISINDKLLLLLANDTVLTINSTGIQSFKVDNNKNIQKHQYNIAPGYVEQLARYPIQSLRIYYYDGHKDFDIATAQANELKKGNALFYNTLVKEKVILKLTPIALTYALKHIGDSVSLSGKVTGVDYAWDGKSKVALLYLGLPFPNHYMVLSIPASTDNLSGTSPEEFYINKEISVKGTLVLRNNRPLMQVNSKKQLYINTPVKLEEINNYVGDSVLVYGQVISEMQLKEKEKNLRVLNMGIDYPDQLLTVFISDAAKNIFPQALNFFEGKVVRVRGRVLLYNGKPGITVSKPDQID
jgi:hypothetical protein